MTFSISYALSAGSDISTEDKKRVLKSVLQSMDDEGRVLRSRVETQIEILECDDVKLIEGLDYAIVGLAEYPHSCVIYDYVRCVEIIAVREGLPMEEASEKVEEIITRNEEEEDGPIFVYPLDYVDEEDLDDYDLLSAHEIVFKNSDD